MTAEIVQFPKKDGNGAREAVMGVMRDPHMRGTARRMGRTGRD